MSFRDHATTETSELVTRLLSSWSEHSRRELESLRSALNSAAQATETALAGLSSDEATPAMSAVIEKLTAAAQADVEAVAARVSADGVKKLEALRKELHSKANELTKAAAALEAAHTDAESVKAQLRAQVDETKSVREELGRAQETCSRLEKEQDGFQAQLQAMQRDVEGRLRKAHEDAEARLQEAQDAAQALLEETQQQVVTVARHAEQEKTSLEKQIAELAEQLDQARSEGFDITKQLETEAADRAKLAAVLGRAQSQGQSADAERKKIAEQMATVQARVRTLEAAQADLEREKADLQQRLQSAAAGGASQPVSGEVSAKLVAQPLDRLLNAYQKLEQSRTVRDVLSAIVDGLAGEFARVAAFEVNGNHLEGLRQLGFESERDMSKVVMPLSMESLLTEAAATGRIQSLSGPNLADGSRTLFGGEPSFILALPIAVGEEVLAVVYADDSDGGQREPSVPQNQVKFAQLLLWHAVPRLPRLVREHRDRTELLEYAGHLTQQIQESYEADVKSGRKGDDLVKRVSENLKCAKDMFTSRAEVLDDADALFEERLSALLDDAKSTPFARDLAAATGRGKGQRERTRQARQVS